MRRLAAGRAAAIWSGQWGGLQAIAPAQSGLSGLSGLSAQRHSDLATGRPDRDTRGMNLHRIDLNLLVYLDTLLLAHARKENIVSCTQ